MVEGDSDPILINALLQTLVEAGELDVDLNPVSILATGDSRNADPLIRILTESATAPLIAALFDNDEGGRRRRALLEELAQTAGVRLALLPDENTSIESYVPGGTDLMVRAYAHYLGQLTGRPVNELHDALQVELAKRPPEQSFGSAIRAAAQAAAQLKTPPSPVGAARAYVQILDELGNARLDPSSLAEAKKVGDRIRQILELETRTVREDRIFPDE